jgi:hypothetical protein
MGSAESTLQTLSNQFVKNIHEVDDTIGENNDYGAGIGPHDEDDQIDSLVEAVKQDRTFPGSLFTVKSNPSQTEYPGGQSADLVIETDETTIFCEAKLFRFQYANGRPSPQAFSKVFNPYQDHSPRSFIHDVEKLASSEVATHKGFIGLYYRPVSGAGTEITGEEVAEKFASDVVQWTDHSIGVVSVSQFEELQHDVHSRGAILSWLLDSQPQQWFKQG